MYHFCFILEQTLGHITHGLNLQHYISLDPTIQVEWGLPAWQRYGMAGRIPLYRNNWTLQAGLRTRQILTDFNRRAKLDALFFHTQVTAVLSPGWLRRIPSIVSLDATPRQYDRLGDFYQHATGPAWLERWKWYLNRNCFRLTTQIITWSSWAGKGLVEEYEVPAEKITVIPPGVDIQAWSRPHSVDTRAGPVRILFVGANFERKGGRILLEAYRYLRRQFQEGSSDVASPPIELHMVTHDKIEPEPGVFLYQSMEPNSQPLKDLFFQSDIFCLPTLGDCLPMVLSEAGAAALPMVSTRLAAIPEIVRDGETGFLVEPNNLESLTVALQRLILNPDLRLCQGRSAERLIRQEFDAGKNASKLVDLMKRVSARL